VRHEGVGVDLAAHGERVAPVDEDRRAVGPLKPVSQASRCEWRGTYSP
jgi:hypothetical protein